MKVEACSFGPVARQALQQSSKATVVAAFDRSFYLETDGYLICVASECLYDGPFNILTQPSECCSTLPGFPIAVGQRWTIGNGFLSSIDGPKIDIGLGGGLAWQPKPPPTRPPHRGQLRLATERLRKFAASRSGPDGLLNLVLDRCNRPMSATERAAIAPLHDLPQHILAWLSDGDLQIIESLGDLLGLGPGLTPSGDDLIAGLMIACRYVDQERSALELWSQLRSHAKNRTTPVSFAHLSAAGQGMGAAPFHELLDTLIENRTADMAEALDAVARIGHCSGWDAVGGLLLLFDAWIAAGEGQDVSAA